MILSVRRHGEAAVVADLLTQEHGRHAGLVHGGNSRGRRGMLQPGNQVALHWRARLVEQLGTYTCELVRHRTALLHDDRDRLAAISAVCALCGTTVPERAPCREVFDGVVNFLDRLEQSSDWKTAYVRWELSLLADLGFGLDLRKCAVTGRTDGLAFVSPRSGRAVVAEAAEPYRGRLLPLPAFLASYLVVEDAASEDIATGLALTGSFLERHVLNPHGRVLPLARARLVDRIGRSTTTSGEDKAS